MITERIDLILYMHSDRMYLTSILETQYLQICVVSHEPLWNHFKLNKVTRLGKTSDQLDYDYLSSWKYVHNGPKRPLDIVCITEIICQFGTLQIMLHLLIEAEWCIYASVN